MWEFFVLFCVSVVLLIVSTIFMLEQYLPGIISRLRESRRRIDAKPKIVFDTLYCQAFHTLCDPQVFNELPPATGSEIPTEYGAHKLRDLVAAMEERLHQCPALRQYRCFVQYSATKPWVVARIVLLNPVQHEGQLMMRDLKLNLAPNQFFAFNKNLRELYRILEIE